MISDQDYLQIIRERDEYNLEIVKQNMAVMETELKALLLGQAEMEAYDWDKLDDLTYSFDGRAKMKAIRSGKDT